MTVESRAAIVRMSAHDTTPGHTFSTRDLIRSMTENPRTELLLGLAVFSPIKFPVSSRSIDPSQPWKNSLTSEGRVSKSQDNPHQSMEEEYLHKAITLLWRGLAFTKQSWKWRRSSEAPMRCSLATAALTADRIVERALGQEES
ncbi:unnamed protein product [Spirodela intermedia]|uniref:Uncharacterized protein n=1 Tax=Spirodela intermedia TaxID=51605 RepID=A0A7I8IGC0_SPIIN|nr:unnamed protein product [Spirodela intermedia]CAA6656940.1 unnamed protein product [Spirodela intermedia]